MTGSDDGSSGSGGESDDEAVDADADLDAVHPVSTSLRSVQHGGRETDASADAAEEQSVGDAPEMDPDGLNEVQPVSSELRSVQNRVGVGEIADAGDDGEAGASDADGSSGGDD
ncbi:hypothetical protein D8Y22_13695 [Salinadaptatus halalkaliphilus]|uniref:Uncharacterized protein n=1 Tax=Salinadaptatus halalkaliphilus TaxID=2419781 RepID=A0A4S3TL20_9EURY|nr:hypothetical protein [Salinadaptatus halalkaliphilus]THE64280.1 hypothetical protein D8Y22_13695 [Salinadaptatus halalkaliphilus]